MASSRAHNPLRQKRGKRRVRRIIHVLPEGETERDYLAMASIKTAVQSGGCLALKFVRGHKGQTDPVSLVRQMTAHLRKEDFRSDDEAWLIIDVDNWTREQIEIAVHWEASDRRHHLAISNPKFELFLLMHYCNAFECHTPADVDNRLKRYWPDYKKRIPINHFSQVQVLEAARRSSRCARNQLLGVNAKAGTEMGELILRLFDGSDF